VTLVQILRWGNKPLIGWAMRLIWWAREVWRRPRTVFTNPTTLEAMDPDVIKKRIRSRFPWRENGIR
jgi:hypothetical protein